VSAAPPTVSVVLRTYGHADYIAQAIDSVLIQQTPFEFELVIGEDCSTDGTREIVREYAERHPETIRAVLPERNIGHGAIFERAIEATRGELIAYLDGDDYWTSPQKLSRQVDFLMANPSFASCFHDVSLVYGEMGTPSGAVIPRLAEQSFSLEDILLDCFVPAPSMLFRRAVLERLPDWTFEIGWIDWLIHIAAATLGPLGYIPAPLAAYRVHAGGMFSARDRISQVEEDLPFYERLAGELPEQRELIERCVAYRHCQLAIERLGVPFDACVVLIDPRREMNAYFNGRHVRGLPRRDTRPVTELEAIRGAAATLSEADQHYDSPIEAVDGQGHCYVVVPAFATSWLEARPQLADYLGRHGEVAWEDEWCAVHELPAAGGSARSLDRSRSPVRLDVAMSAPRPDGLVGANLEAPAAGALLPAHAVSVCGWALGGEAEVVAVEFATDAGLLWRSLVRIERADVAAAFPDAGEAKPGFQTTVNLSEVPPGATVEIRAVTADGARLCFATLTPRAAGERGASASGP